MSRRDPSAPRANRDRTGHVATYENSRLVDRKLGCQFVRRETDLVRRAFLAPCPRTELSRWAEGILRCELRGNPRAEEDYRGLFAFGNSFDDLKEPGGCKAGMSGVTAWVASAISRATMQNDLKLLPLTMRAPPSVTSSTA